MTAGTDRLDQLAISASGFVFDPRSGATFTVNDAGGTIIEGLRIGAGLDAIAEALQDAFACDRADLRRDALEYVRQLRDQGLLPADFQLT